MAAEERSNGPELVPSSENPYSTPSSDSVEKNLRNDTNGELPLDDNDSKAQEDLIIEEKSEPSNSPPKLSPVVLIILAVSFSLSIFCIGIDNTILATATPKITDQFGSINDIGWYGSAYSLTTCGFQLFFGKLYSFYEVKWVYLIALAIFEIGSLICAVAPSSIALIIGRAIAGVGAAGMSQGVFLMIALLIEVRRRAIFTGLIGSMYGLACVAGPLIGGAFTDNPKLTWRWCFYINLPVGAVSAASVLIFLRFPLRVNADKKIPIIEQIKQMDLLGSLCLLPGVICLLIALQWGGSRYPWSNGRVIALVVVAGFLLIGFVIIQVYSGDNATVHPKLIKNRNVWGAVLYGASGVGTFFVFLYYLPLWLQAVKSASAIQSGTMNLPMLIGYIVFSVFGGSLTTALGTPIPFIYLSVPLLCIGAGLLSSLTVDSGPEKWITFQVLLGGGSGLIMNANLVVVQTALPIADVPVATAICMFSQHLASTIFISVAQNVFASRLVANIRASVPGLDSREVLRVGATELKNLEGVRDFLPEVLSAYNDAVTRAFLVGTGLSCLAVIGVLGIQPKAVNSKRKNNKNEEVQEDEGEKRSGGEDSR